MVDIIDFLHGRGVPEDAILLMEDQKGETHDSTEDSCTALKLYRKFLELYQEGGNHYVTKVLYELYDKGFQLNWKVPDLDARWSV